MRGFLIWLALLVTAGCTQGSATDDQSFAEPGKGAASAKELVELVKEAAGRGDLPALQQLTFSSGANKADKSKCSFRWKTAIQQKVVAVELFDPAAWLNKEAEYNAKRNKVQAEFDGEVELANADVAKSATGNLSDEDLLKLNKELADRLEKSRLKLVAQQEAIDKEFASHRSVDSRFSDIATEYQRIVNPTDESLTHSTLPISNYLVVKLSKSMPDIPGSDLMTFEVGQTPQKAHYLTIVSTEAAPTIESAPIDEKKDLPPVQLNDPMP